MGRNLKLALTAATVVALTGCQQPSDDEASVAPKNLYITAGLCTSGPGVTTYTAAAATVASRAITKWSTTEPSKQISTVIDWNVASGFANSLPQQVILNNHDGKLLILAENATTMTERKVYSVDKDNPSIYNTIVPNTASVPAAAATSIVRNMLIDKDGYITVNRTNVVEKFNPVGAVIPGPRMPAAAYIAPLAATGACFNASTFTTGTVTPGGTYVGVSSIASLDPAFGRATGKTIMSTMGSALANNRLAAVNFSGLTSATAADCAGGTAITGVAHNLATNLCPDGGCAVNFHLQGVAPTAMVFIKTPAPAATTGKLLVTYAPSNNDTTPATSTANNTNALNHGLVVWDVTEVDDTTVNFDNPVVLYHNDQVIVAPSAITYDEATSEIYVAVGPTVRSLNQVASNQGYNIEKFSYDMNAATVERVHDGNYRPFITGNTNTKCVSSMIIGD